MLQHLFFYKDDKGWQGSFLLYMLFYCRDWSPDIRVGRVRVCKCQHYIITLYTAQRQKAAGFCNDSYTFRVGKN